MSSNPLFELVVWAVESSKKINSEYVWDLVTHAPQYYEAWWTRVLKESPQHILIETGLLLFIVWLMFIRRTVDPAKVSSKMKLSSKEQEWLIETWEPEPLVPTISSKDQDVIDSTWVGCWCIS